MQTTFKIMYAIRCVGYSGLLIAESAEVILTVTLWSTNLREREGGREGEGGREREGGREMEGERERARCAIHDYYSTLLRRVCM